jgi:hypothetical protein
MTHFYYLSGESLELQVSREWVAGTRQGRSLGQEGLLQRDRRGGRVPTAAGPTGGELLLLGDGLQRIKLDPAVSNHCIPPQNRLSV